MNHYQRAGRHLRRLTGASPGRLLACIGAVVAVAVVVFASYVVAELFSIRSLRESTKHRMDIYSASLQAEMNRFEYLPSVVALNDKVAALLQNPTDRELIDAVNRYLKTVNTKAGASAIYVMNRDGLTLAASNWDQSTSFVNMNFAYRPYFRDAMQGGPGRFYGIGTVSREAGYYFGDGIVRHRRLEGVAAVKVNLEKLDRAWGHEGEKIAVVDGNGVIFLASEPSWKYRTLRALSSETMGRLAQTRQYTEAGLLSPLGLKEQRAFEDGTAIVQIAAEPIAAQPPRAPYDYLMHGNEVPGTDWRLIVLSELSPARAAARKSAALTTLTFVLLGTLVLYFRQHRRTTAQVHAARIALQRAHHEELERKVAQRTEAFGEVNRKLEAEIAERKRAEDALRGTLEDLVHTTKMATLGQMSAGITHELNQPLAALRTLSESAIVFLERGQLDLARENLQVIAQRTHHMAKLTAQLKKFARKSALDMRPSLVSAVVSDALFLLTQSARASSVRIDQRIEPPDLLAICDTNRFEQVLLNLLSNALDAVANVTEGKVLLAASEDGGWVDIEVHDNGPGISAAIEAHLFEPFFSTKEQGMGLGLGLAISAGIVRDLGGTLKASRSPQLGGAMFTVRLQAVVMEMAHA